MTAEPRPRQVKFWGWVAFGISVVIAVVYLLIAKPWSTYDGTPPSNHSRKAAHPTAGTGHSHAASITHARLG